MLDVIESTIIMVFLILSGGTPNDWLITLVPSEPIHYDVLDLLRFRYEPVM